MSSDRPSAPNLVVLSADVLATRAKRLIDSLFDGSFEPIRDNISELRSAIDTYELVRSGGIISDPDPQKMNSEVAPTTERSAPR